MNTRALVKILRCWHIVDGELYCPQCWGTYLTQFDAEGIAMIKRDTGDGNTPWTRNWPICELCGRDAREGG